jgi:NAD(P)-dependent dehydrogenase (short-subunit alcohol dehydrogenase family)
MARIVVTGASTGIGRACAERLARDGHAVIAGVRKDADAEALRAAHLNIEPAMLDVTDAAQVAALAERVGEEPLHGLVNNAGIGVGGPLEFVPLDELRRQMEVNLVGPVAVTQALLEALRRARGRIVFIGSVGGRVPGPFLGPYQASKGAVRQIAGALRQELHPWGMHVALVEPGAVATPIWRKAGGEYEATVAALPERARELYGERLARIPELLRRQDAAGVPPEQVAAAVAHALTASRPRAVYTVGRDAHAQKALQALLPAPAFDALVRRVSGLR